MGPSTIHTGPLSWALAKLWMGLGLSQAFEAPGDEGWRGPKRQKRGTRGLLFHQVWWIE